MEHTEPTIEIIRVDGKLSSIKVIMPIWHSIGDDGFIKILAPLFGDMETYAPSIESVDEVLKEAIHCFVIICEEAGNGFESELKLLGWKQNNTNTLLSINSNIPAFDSMLNTGEPHELWLQVA